VSVFIVSLFNSYTHLISLSYLLIIKRIWQVLFIC